MHPLCHGFFPVGHAVFRAIDTKQLIDITLIIIVLTIYSVHTKHVLNDLLLLTCFYIV